MAHDPALDPRNILQRRLAPNEQIRSVIDGARLCADFRMSGPVLAPILLGHSVVHAARGGTWVPGIWAISDINLHYISRRRWFGWQGVVQAFDVAIPLPTILDTQPFRGWVVGTCFKIIHESGTLRVQARSRDADNFIPLLMLVQRQVPR